ncbi:nuclear transport factor 2 family protein [Lutibacter citreus]|uniref:nuclear transport factor 2 family protein n=1 Tax=Lutibacter citreus TaxID=2138210 RepID=UPI000DBE2FF5|nr:nuclear transport factor 2 family protein [Lutibacter citreus]
MNTEENKQLVREFWESFTAADIEKAFTYLDDNVVWRSMGVEGELPVSGEMDKNGIGELIKNVKVAIPKGLELKMLGFTAEDNRVANEVESYGELTNGKIYKNLYHFFIEISNGKIIKIKEYMDTIHVKKIFVD